MAKKQKVATPNAVLDKLSQRFGSYVPKGSAELPNSATSIQDYNVFLALVALKNLKIRHIGKK